MRKRDLLVALALVAFAPPAIAAPKQKGHKVAAQHHLVATFPGFQMLDQGGSRIFVELTQSAQVSEEKKGAGKFVYRLKGAQLVKRNNRNPLVTVHFNTPVSRAQLVPHGRDLLLNVSLRAAVNPTWKVVPGKDGTFVLQVDFPAGDYLPKGAFKGSDKLTGSDVGQGEPDSQVDPEGNAEEKPKSEPSKPNKPVR